MDRPKQEPLVFRTEILTENAMEAQHLASVHAFWHLAKGQVSFMGPSMGCRSPESRGAPTQAALTI